MEKCLYSNIFYHKILNRHIVIAFKIQEDFHSPNPINIYRSLNDREKMVKIYNL